MGAETAIGMGLAGLLQGVLEGAGARMKQERKEKRVKEAHDQNTLETELLKAGNKHPELYENPAYQAFFQEAFGGKKGGGRQTGVNPGESLINFMKLKSTYAQALESRKGTTNQEVVAQGAQDVRVPGQSSSYGDAKLPGGRQTFSGPPEPTFGPAADALIWQRFNKRPSQATEAESSWAKAQATQEKIAREAQERVLPRAEQLKDEELKALSKALLPLQPDVQKAMRAEEAVKTGTRMQTEIDVKADPANMQKIEDASRASEKGASAGRELGKVSKEVLQAQETAIRQQYKLDREKRRAQPLSPEDQVKYGGHAGMTVGEAEDKEFVAMSPEDRKSVTATETALNALKEMRWIASKVNNFTAANQIWSKGERAIQTFLQTNDPEFRMERLYVLHARNLVNAMRENGKLTNEDVTQTEQTLYDPSLTLKNALAALDRVEGRVLDVQDAVLAQHVPVSKEGLTETRVRIRERMEALKPADQKDWENATQLFYLEGRKELGPATKPAWDAWAEKYKKDPKEMTLSPVGSGALFAPPTPKEDPLTPDTLLFLGGHPELGAFKIDQWDEVGKQSGIDLNGQHFYRTEKEARENKDGGGPAKAPGPQSKRGWRRGQPASVRG